MLTRGERVHVHGERKGGGLNSEIWRNTINLQCANAKFTSITTILTTDHHPHRHQQRERPRLLSTKWNVSGLHGIFFLTMEIENIVANTVLLKAREGKRQSIIAERVLMNPVLTLSRTRLNSASYWIWVYSHICITLQSWMGFQMCSLINSISFSMLVRTNYAQSPLSDPWWRVLCIFPGIHNAETAV